MIQSDGSALIGGGFNDVDGISTLDKVFRMEAFTPASPNPAVVLDTGLKKKIKKLKKRLKKAKRAGKVTAAKKLKSKIKKLTKKLKAL